MSRRPLVAFLHAVPPRDLVPDSELLRRFADRRDEAAFELLVRRHADAVWAVCRGVLRHDADAEDAFQATFLALTRKSGAVRTACVAGWLHRVAVHAALKLRAKRGRVAGPLPDDVPASNPGSFTDASAVHEELAALPDRYRLPVVLCDLEGQTHTAAAAALGWPVGTVAGRLSRARDRLRGRLARRGLGGVAASLASGPAPAGIVRTAAAVGAGAIPSTQVISLTNGVLFAMNATKSKWVAALAAAAVGLTAGTIWAVGSHDTVATTTAADPPKAAPPAAAAPAPKPNEKPVAGAKERALSMRNLRYVAFAIERYSLDHGHLPTDILDKKTGKPLLSWRVAILPYMEQRNVYSQFKLDEPWDSEHNKRWGQVIIKVYSAGVDPLVDPDKFGLTVVKRFTGPNTSHRPGEAVALPRANGKPLPVLVAEIGDPVPWTKPTDTVVTPADPPLWSGPYSNVMNAVFADFVSFPLRPDIPSDTVRQLVTTTGGQGLDKRQDWTAVPSVERIAADNRELLAIMKKMADLRTQLDQEELKLRAELAKTYQDDRVAGDGFALLLAGRLIDLQQQLGETRRLVEELRGSAEHRDRQPPKK